MGTCSSHNTALVSPKKERTKSTEAAIVDTPYSSVEQNKEYELLGLQRRDVRKYLDCFKSFKPDSKHMVNINQMCLDLDIAQNSLTNHIFGIVSSSDENRLSFHEVGFA
jgi:hypothetical protein